MRERLAWILAAVLLVAAANAVLVLTDVLPALSAGAFAHQTDADSYTRLLRVQALWQGASPHDTRLAAMAAPEGLDVHWGHVVDYLLLAAAALLAPFLGFETALFRAGLIFGPVMEVLALLALYRGLRGLVPWWGIAVGMLALVLARNVTINSGVGRADHHALEAFLAVAVQAGLLRAALVEGVRRRETLLAGAACGLGVWATPEGLIVFLPAVCAIVLGDRGGARLVPFAGAALAVMALGMAVERPPSDWLAVEPDRLSALQMAVVAMPLAAGWLAAHFCAPGRRGFVLTGGLLAAGSVALVAAFPLLLQGGYANIDPVSRQAILAAVEGEASLFPDSPQNAYSFFFDVWASVLVLLWCVVAAVRSRGTAPATAMIPYLVVGILLTLHAARVTLFLQAFTAVPWALMVVAAARHRAWAWAPVAALFATGPAVAEGVIAPAWFPNATSGNRPLCEYSDIAPALRAVPGEGTILTALFKGPEVAYKTGRPTLGGPYHRAAASILDLQTIMMRPDPRASETAARDRAIGFVLLCRREAPYLRRVFMENPAALLTRLYRGAPPPWLEPVALPPDLARTYLLYRRRG